MINYPVAFEANATTNPGINVTWNSLASDQETVCSIPKEFEGPGGAFSPEDYFLLALQNCFIATFKVFAEHSRLEFDELKVNSKLMVSKDNLGKPWMESAHLTVNISGIKDEKKCNLLIKKTFDSGFILRSVKTNISYDVVIH